MKFWIFLASIGALLNLTDAFLTVYSVGSRIATEANPVMAALLNISIPLFYAAKLLVAGLFIVLAMNSKQALARVGIFAALLSYTGVTLHHLQGLLFTA